MSIGTVNPRGKRIAVDFDTELADMIAMAADARSTMYKRVTVSDVIREAVARFVLPSAGTDSSHNGTNTTASATTEGSLS